MPASSARGPVLLSQAEAPAGKPVMHSLIRSKGFVWLSNSHPQMFYWALAGKHFELKAYATWWAVRATPAEEGGEGW